MPSRQWWIASVLLTAFGLPLLGPTPAAQASPPRKPKPRVEVVFCLDTTGSMGGLIDGAKQKIWSLCNQIVGGKPTPDLKVGLVAYRDRGDAYVTKVTDLTADLDAIHQELLSFKADGGGDTPESVNEALHVALNNIQWSSNAKVLRIIYLVGDAPPHMDYANDISYTVSCREACERGIIINTIQCGTMSETTPVWQEIARKAEGRFVQIAQDGGVQTVSTPFDVRLAEINTALAKTNVVYGDAPTQAAALARNAAVVQGPMMGGMGGMGSDGSVASGAGGRIQFAPVFVSPTMNWAVPSPSMGGMPTTAPMYNFNSTGPLPAPCASASCATIAADRAGYVAKSGKVAALDLLDAIKEGKVQLEKLKTEELPIEMQKLTLAKQRAYLAKMEREREQLRSEALKLDQQRTDFINQELSRRNGASGFDTEVMQMLRDQAKKHNIAY